MKPIKKETEHITIESTQECIDASIPDSVCPMCKDSGWITYEDDQKMILAKECSCGIAKRIVYDKRLKFANIPKAFNNSRLENFKKSVYKDPVSQEMIVEAAKVIRYWFQNIERMKAEGIGLYFYSGTKGSGKTRLAASVANELIYKYNTRVSFSTSLKILEEIKSTWNGQSSRDTYGRSSQDSTESKLMNALTMTEVLVIDDFGVEQIKGWIMDRFYSLINGRYEDKKITIFTSNMRPDDLPYEDRIISRIVERVLQIPFPEESVRDLLAKQLKQEMLIGISQDNISEVINQNG